MRVLKEKSLIDKEKMIQLLRSKKRLPVDNLPENLIVLMVPSAIHAIRKKYNSKKESFFIGDLDRINKNVAILSRIGIGAPALTLFLEKAISMGVRRIILVGSAGRLQSQIQFDQFVLALKAFSDEGTSRHYFADKTVFQSSGELTRVFFDFLKTKSCSVFESATWTTDAFYRETATQRDNYLSKGAGVVDMETSALYALAEYYQIEALSLFVLSDDLSANDWAPQMMPFEVKIQLLLELTVEFFHDEIKAKI